MNKWIGMGRLTKDPEIRYTTGENKMAIAKFSIAVDRRGKKGDHPEADFFPCTAFGKTAEACERYWKKGMKALVTGRLQNDSWTNKEGQKVTQTVVLIDDIEFCEKKQEEAKQEPAAAPAANWEPLGDEELPWKF